MTLPAWDTLAGWAGQGQRAVEQAAARLEPAQVTEPSRLPGWTRGHVLSHLARNADALVNLLTWARTGVETVMYASAEARDEEIAETAATGSSSAQQIGIWTTRKSLASLLPRS